MGFTLTQFLAALATLPSAQIDPARIDAELAADADVLRLLKENGDVPTVKRPVDVRFVGEPSAVTKLEADINSMGWRVVQKIAIDAGEVALDVQTDQTTDPAAIRELTEMALRIEARYGVRYDGWGTVATKR